MFPLSVLSEVLCPVRFEPGGDLDVVEGLFVVGELESVDVGGVDVVTFGVGVGATGGDLDDKVADNVQL